MYKSNSKNENNICQTTKFIVNIFGTKLLEKKEEAN